MLLQLSDAIGVSDLDALQKISLKLFLRLLIDLAAVVVLVKLVYYPKYKKTDLDFTFFVFNVVIFLICFLLNKVDLSMGAAFGLFAVFSMLRYRTEEISIKDMSYLFLVIAMGLICAVTKIKDAGDIYEYLFLVFINSMVVFIAFILESKLFFNRESVKMVTFDNIQLIQPHRQNELISDLRSRTGLDIHRVSIIKIDFVNDTALMKIYYYEN
ncbi:MAG: DUF4956 domain-containing protein [Bacteroidota bacterium]